MGMEAHSEKEEVTLEEIKTLLQAGTKAKGDQDVVFKQTSDGKLIVSIA
jgi:hypothetical protein